MELLLYSVQVAVLVAVQMRKNE